MEESTRVPLIISVPGKKPAVCHSFAELLDLYPTLAELAGLPTTKQLEGKSFASILRGEKPAAARQTTFAYFYDRQRMIRTDRWKLIEYPQLSKHQLFDLRADPFERHDLSEHPDHAVTRTKLEAQLRSWQRIHKDPLITEG
jgi:arylsulfatase A-like enzyme